MIVAFRNNTDIPVNETILKELEAVAALALKSENIQMLCELCITIVSNEEIRALNKKYRKLDTPTDVLSFPTNAFIDNQAEPVYIGDIVISIEKAISQADEYGHSLLRELAFLTVHSVLHLLGYDHMNEDEKEIMFEKQDEILKLSGIERELV